MLQKGHNDYMPSVRDQERKGSENSLSEGNLIFIFKVFPFNLQYDKRKSEYRVRPWKMA